METEYIKVGLFSELRDGRARKVTVGDHEVALWRVGGKLYAVGNVCAHQHFSMIHQGTVEGQIVRCPMHGWEYSLETGTAVSGNGTIPVFEVKLDGESVLISREPRMRGKT